MSIAQPLHPTGQARQFPGEGGEDGKPMAMPSEDAHANRTYFGRSGELKAGRPLRLGGNANRLNTAPAITVQRAKRKRSK